MGNCASAPAASNEPAPQKASYSRHALCTRPCFLCDSALSSTKLCHFECRRLVRKCRRSRLRCQLIPRGTVVAANCCRCRAHRRCRPGSMAANLTASCHPRHHQWRIYIRHFLQLPPNPCHRPMGQKAGNRLSSPTRWDPFTWPFVPSLVTCCCRCMAQCTRGSAAFEADTRH